MLGAWRQILAREEVIEMLSVEQQKGGYYVLRYSSDGVDIRMVFQAAEGVDADALEPEPNGLRLRMDD